MSSQIRHLGFEAIELRCGQTRAVVVPALGGRIMSLQHDGHEFLFTNPALHGKLFSFEEHSAGGTLLDWKNYGGDKTWPAPQGWEHDGQWPGPPDPHLDSGVYDARFGSDGKLVLTSPSDPRTGLQVQRSLWVEESGLQLELRFLNQSSRQVRWAIWNVTQLSCSSPGPHWLYMASEPGRSPRILFGAESSDFLAQLYDQALPGVLGVKYDGHVGKVGTASPANWLAFCSSGRVLAMHSRFQGDCEYPDGGCSLECWTESPGAPAPLPLASPGRLLEAEVLGPLTTLAPGQSSSLSIQYRMARFQSPLTLENQAQLLSIAGVSRATSKS